MDKVVCLLKNEGRFVFSIDKNQEKYIEMGTRKIPVFPDNLEDSGAYIKKAGLKIIEQSETEFAHIFVAIKIDNTKNQIRFWHCERRLNRYMRKTGNTGRIK